jgi:hypothetical protein
MKHQENKTNATDRTASPGPSPPSRPSGPERVLPPHGGYESLRTPDLVRQPTEKVETTWPQSTEERA